MTQNDINSIIRIMERAKEYQGINYALEKAVHELIQEVEKLKLKTEDTDTVLMTWISTQERLPTENDANVDFEVLANHIACKKQSWHWRSVAENPFDFTSWMPIPKAPRKNYYEKY